MRLSEVCEKVSAVAISVIGSRKKFCTLGTNFSAWASIFVLGNEFNTWACNYKPSHLNQQLP
jgi:hypothetical protein